MRSLVVLAGLLAVAAAAYDVSDEVWAAWKAKYGKSYDSPAEEAFRRHNWNVNADRVIKHNLEESLGMHTYTQEMNHLQDLSYEEYLALLSPMPPKRHLTDAEHTHEEVGSNPSSVNWVTAGLVTSVKNQGSCGSCWSFSASGGLEGQYAKSHPLTSLSEQQLVSCDTYDGGCNGGWYYSAWQYLIKYGGQESESVYPYTDTNGAYYPCEQAGKPITATLRSYKCTTQGSESALENAVAQVGPVSVAIDASQPSFGSYKSGVYSSSSCSSTYLDHAVLTVGYGTSNGQKYWNVKNSWGTSWGQQGYIWMARDDGNMCGIASGPPCYPVV